MKDLKTIYWHDGIFLNIDFSMRDFKKDLNLSLMLYENNESSKRKEIRFIFHNIDDLSVNIDTEILRDNQLSGNIDNVFLYKKNTKNRLVFHLMEGYINFTFNKVTVTNI